MSFRIIANAVPTLLCFFTGHASLSDHVRNWMEDPQYHKLISVVSVWEMTIKQSQQKLTLLMSAADYIQMTKER